MLCFVEINSIPLNLVCVWIFKVSEFALCHCSVGQAFPIADTKTMLGGYFETAQQYDVYRYDMASP